MNFRSTALVAFLSFVSFAASAQMVRKGPKPVEFTMDESKSNTIEVKYADDIPSGLLIKPLINGKDLGWFILDFGSPFSTISPAKAAEAQMEAVSQVKMMSPDGPKDVTVYGSKTFTIGNLGTDQFRFSGDEPSSAAKGNHSDIAGIIGGGTFMNYITELSFNKKNAKLSFYKPDGYSKQVNWITSASPMAPVVSVKKEDSTYNFFIEPGINTGLNVFNKSVARNKFTAKGKNIKVVSTFTGNVNDVTPTKWDVAIDSYKFKALPVNLFQNASVLETLPGPFSSVDGVLGRKALIGYTWVYNPKAKQLAIVKN